jgi:thioredoxin reductase (NADPH)
MKEVYDILIVGAGPAGLTAGIYSARSGLKTAVVAKEIGGTANAILKIENWPGYSGTGMNLMKQFYESAKKYKIDFIVSEVESIKKEKDLFVVKAPKEELKSKAIIIATGTERKKLNIEGEKEFLGRGVSYCVTCDGFFFKGKNVVVIGGSDCASTTVLALSDIAKKVYLIYRGGTLKCDKITSDKISKKENIEILYNTIPLKILGDKKVQELEIMKDKKKIKLKIEGVFIEIGSSALTNLAKETGLKLDSESHIVVNENMESSVKGIYACGDVTNQKLKQVVVASAQGAIAAKSANEWLSK